MYPSLLRSLLRCDGYWLKKKPGFGLFRSTICSASKSTFNGLTESCHLVQCLWCIPFASTMLTALQRAGVEANSSSKYLSVTVSHAVVRKLRHWLRDAASLDKAAFLFLYPQVPGKEDSIPVRCRSAPLSQTWSFNPQIDYEWLDPGPLAEPWAYFCATQ